LIKAGAMDCLGNRGILLNSIDRLLSMAQREQKMRSSGQSTMFDLFGQTAPVPMASLDLSGEDVLVKEKLTWEKELMGVYLSEHPFAQYSRFIDTENTTLPSQITAELDGQNITMVGIVETIRELITTRDHRPFCSAMMGDDVTAIEVMVWNRIYEDTRELWKEGNFLRIEGKVKVKEERLQVTCDAVEICEQEVQPKAIALAVSSLNNATQKNNGKGKNGNEKSHNGKPANGNNGKPAESYKLTFIIQETEDEAKDEAYLNELRDMLKEFPGQDEVYLRIFGAEKVTNLKWSSIFVGYSPDLRKKLSRLVSPEHLIVEKL